MTCIRYYTLRWLIERYHYTLKSGCQLEQLQLETADRIKRAFVTYSLVAWRLLWLTYQSRLEPDTSCECILETDEWQALACHHLGHHQPPVEPPTLGEAVLMLARVWWVSRQTERWCAWCEDDLARVVALDGSGRYVATSPPAASSHLAGDRSCIFRSAKNTRSVGNG